MPLGVVHRSPTILAIHTPSGHGEEDHSPGQEFQDVVAGNQGESEATVRSKEFQEGGEW